MEDLVPALIACVRALPAAHVRAVANALALSTGPADARRNAAAALPHANYRRKVTQLIELWERHPMLTGATIALALQTAAAVLDEERATEVVEVVATGPISAHVSLRQTKAVLLSLIDDARAELIIVSYAAYQVADLVGALQRARERGVIVRLVLETKADSGGALSFDASAAFQALRDVELFVWPLERRESGGRLHAKTAIADGEVAFVTSANLTGSALEENLEVGVLIRGGQSPRRLMDHFHELIAAGILRRT